MMDFGFFLNINNKLIVTHQIVNYSLNNSLMQKGDFLNKIKKGIKLPEVSLVGVLQGLISLPLEHPFDTIKTWMQSQNVGTRQAISQIREKKGYKGFYSGFIVNCLRVIVKNSYRWPLNVYLIFHFRDMFAHFENSRSLAGAATGLATAIIESAVVCPFQRIKIWLMTSPQYLQFSTFFNIQNLRSLFDGFLPVMAKQSVSWVSFLGTQEYFKQIIYRHYKKTPSQYQLSTKDLTIVSILVCICNTVCVMPVDFIKTHYQKFSSFKKGSPIAIVRQIYKLGGLRPFYRGGTVKMIQYNINAFFSVQLFERVLRAYDKS